MNTAALDTASTTADGFTPDQQRYLEGFFAGIAAGGVSFGDLTPTPRAAAASSPIQEGTLMPIILWLLGVPLVVIVLLYLLNIV